MARTVIPPPPRTRGTLADPPAAASAPAGGDSFPDKLVKYVPAETLAFLVPAAAALGSERDTFLIAVLVVAALGTFGYLWLNARMLPEEKRPLKHFYVLAEIALFCWAVATIPTVASLFRIDSVLAAVILLVAVFLIPVADNMASTLLRSRVGITPRTARG